jgi:hypothetical protein
VYGVQYDHKGALGGLRKIVFTAIGPFVYLRPASGIPQNSNMATLRSQMQKDYYVSMFDPRSNIPGDGVHYRLVGPFTTLDEATPHVDRTRTVARELDFRADFCSFGVLATEVTKPGVLNSKSLA